MKKIMLYAFIVAVLFNIWQYGFWNSSIENEAKRTEIIKKNHQKARDSIAVLKEKLDEASYFSLENNEEALDYLSEYDLTILIPHIREEINNMNTLPKGNPLIPLDPMGGNKFVINKIKFLNNRWIIGDFSNGSMWGEIMIKYYINDDETISFETSEYLLHP